MIKHVLVTGGAGFVGSVLIPKLLKNNYRVTCIDTFWYGDAFSDIQPHPQLKLVRSDIRDSEVLKAELQNIDAVIHLACISNDPSFELDPTLGKSINHDATIQLIDLAKVKGVGRFIYASSSSVYGVKNEAEVTEQLTLEPLTDYSKYKVLSENYLLSRQSDDFTTLVLRPATVCGYSPRLRLDLTVNILTIQALVNKKITVFGGNQLRPNIHIEDMTDLYIETLRYRNHLIAGRVYNVGYENYSILSLAQMVKQTLKDPEVKIFRQPAKDLRSYKISSRKILRDLGFKPRRTVEDAILDLKKAYENGKIPDALTNKRYYNIRTMKHLFG